MKSINQIFRNNKSLLDEPEVQELVEYTRELEGIVMEKNIDENYDKEHVLKSMLRDIVKGIDLTIKDDEESIRFNETPRVDYEQSVKNLRDYIRDMCLENRINL